MTQTDDLALRLGELGLARVFEWPLEGAISTSRSRVPSTGACRSRDERYCQELLNTIIKLFQLLLAANDNSPESEREIDLSEMKETCIRLAGESYGLTAREKQVLAKMVEGNSNRKIAAALTISVSTAKSHVSNILSKMGAESRTAAVALALQQQSRSGCRQKDSGAASEAGYSCPLSN